MRSVAAFDVDGTLTRRDTFVPFLVGVAGRVRVTYALSSGLVRARGDRDRLKALVVAQILAGRRFDHLRRHAEAYAERVVRSGLRPWAIAEAERHREAGRTLVMVSASPELYLEPLAVLLGFDAVLGTRLEVDAAGVVTGRLDGPNLRGTHKVDRLRTWLGPEAVELWAYGDAGSDRHMLELADHPVWVGRRRNASPRHGA